MDNKDILKRAIEKAINSGWEGFSYRTDEHGKWLTGPEPAWYLDDAKYYDDIHQFASKDNITVNLNELIFNHDFAEALWGNESSVQDFRVKYNNSVPWIYHLQQMVIAENPIKYLGENI